MSRFQKPTKFEAARNEAWPRHKGKTSFELSPSDQVSLAVWQHQYRHRCRRNERRLINVHFFIVFVFVVLLLGRRRFYRDLSAIVTEWCSMQIVQLTVGSVFMMMGAGHRVKDVLENMCDHCAC